MQLSGKVPLSFSGVCTALSYYNSPIKIQIPMKNTNIWAFKNEINNAMLVIMMTTGRWHSTLSLWDTLGRMDLVLSLIQVTNQHTSTTDHTSVITIIFSFYTILSITRLTLLWVSRNSFVICSQENLLENSFFNSFEILFDR